MRRPRFRIAWKLNSNRIDHRAVQFGEEKVGGHGATRLCPPYALVMPGLDPGIHVLLSCCTAMTENGTRAISEFPNFA
jgi:hypothetical protein